MCTNRKKEGKDAYHAGLISVHETQRLLELEGLVGDYILESSHCTWKETAQCGGYSQVERQGSTQVPKRNTKGPT